jgi:hypothetical protein
LKLKDSLQPYPSSLTFHILSGTSRIEEEKKKDDKTEENGEFVNSYL